MGEQGDGFVLDETTTPAGDFQLVTFRAGGAVWIGYRPRGWFSEAKGSPAQGAIGLHTGSDVRYLNTFASGFGTWGLAFGGFPPEVERVEVRNGLGEPFPAKIIPLPT